MSPTKKKTPARKKKTPARKRVTKQRTTEMVLLLRTCGADGGSHSGFVWPLTVGAEVVAHDWHPRAECGNGLHGLLWGEGDGSLLNWSEDAKWLVVEAEASSVVELSGRAKVPRCVVRYVGERVGAAAYIAERAPAGKAIVSGTATAGYRGTATAGDSGTATAGYRGTIAILYWDDAKQRWRRAIGEVGEGGIEANVPYHVVDGKLVKGQSK